MAKKDTRKSRQHDGAVALGDILNEAIQASREQKSRVEPERPMSEPSDSEVVVAFERQRQRENAVGEPTPPEPPFEPKPRVKSWGETVRPWTSHGTDTGVHHVATTSPNMVGIRFDGGKKRTAEEKREMEDKGMKFFNEAQAWLKPNRNGAFDETQLLAEQFAERRREEMTQERGR